MKKVLALLLIASVAQDLFSQQQPTQYKYLNRLPADSQIKRKCESVKRGWLKGETEKLCDSLDNTYDEYTQMYVRAHNMAKAHPKWATAVQSLKWEYVAGHVGIGLLPSSVVIYPLTVTTMFPEMSDEDKYEEIKGLFFLADCIVSREACRKFEDDTILFYEKK